ncbi:MAG: sulfur carrier protein ThiS [Eubacteriales bacterium]
MIVNGKEMSFDNKVTILELIEKFNLNSNKVVVEVNYEIIEKDKYSQYMLNEEDRIEIISLVGGG